MYSKADIFNLALGALLLQRQITDAESDMSSEARTLRLHYPIALKQTIQDLDLNSTASAKALELVTTNPNTLWDFAYKYPAECAFFRRIRSCERKDSRFTRIQHEVGAREGIKVIYTDQENAIGEFISHNLNLGLLNASAGMALAYRLALLSSALVVGKGAQKIRQECLDFYKLYKADAQRQDQLESDTFQDPIVNSEFVQFRMS